MKRLELLDRAVREAQDIIAGVTALPTSDYEELCKLGDEEEMVAVLAARLLKGASEEASFNTDLEK